MASLSRAEAFARIPDPGGRGGRPHPPVATPCSTPVAVSTGCRSIDAVAVRTRSRDRHGPRAGVNNAGTPAPSTSGERFRQRDQRAQGRAPPAGVLPLVGKVVTADAMFTHTDVCDTITGAGGDCVPAVTDNPEELRRDSAALFEGDGTAFPRRRLWADGLQTAATTNEGHGRIEKRAVTTSTWLNEYRRDGPKRAVRVERERRIGGETGWG